MATENGAQKDANVSGIDLPDPQSSIPETDFTRRNRFGASPGISSHDRLDDILGGVIHLYHQSRLPPHWSRDRDAQLRQLYKYNDAIKTAIYNVTSKISGLRPNISPQEHYDDDHRLSAILQQHLLNRDWFDAVVPFLVDLFTQDNGGFMEILSAVPIEDSALVEVEDDVLLVGPLEPFVLPGTRVTVGGAGLSALDAAECHRTRHPDFPVLVKRHNKKYALHKSRVIYWSSLPSSEYRLNGVGMSALSRAIENAYQNMDAESILGRVLKGEALRSILFVAPWDGDSVLEQYEKALYSAMATSDLNFGDRVTPIAVVGMPPHIHESVGTPVIDFKTEQVLLERLPEGYDKWTYQIEFMKFLASAMGVSFRDLGLEARFGGRTDAQESLKIINLKFAKEFVFRIESELAEKWCTFQTRAEIPFTDPSEEKEAHDAEFSQQRARLAQGQADQISLSNGTVDRQYLIDLQVRNGLLTEVEALRILSAPPEGGPVGTQNVPIVEEGNSLVSDLNNT